MSTIEKPTNKSAFTLVEIMIVVVLVGLLASIAVPAFQKVREYSAESMLYNDARQLSAGAQQYFLESGLNQIGFTIQPNGSIDGVMNQYVKNVSKNYIPSDTSDSIAAGGTFSLAHKLYEKGTPVVFDDGGERLSP